jgi:hypothetical protein
VIFFIALLVFGLKELRELSKGSGEGIRALKDGRKDDDWKPEKRPDSRATVPPNRRYAGIVPISNFNRVCRKEISVFPAGTCGSYFVRIIGVIFCF